MTTTETLTAEQGAALLGRPQPIPRAPKPSHRPIRTSRDIEAEVEERFRKDTAGHELRILHDDGLYRHLLLRNLRGSEYWYELITWPGSLAIRGDVGDGYTFTRLTDMFEFFRSERGGINPHYWAEKLGGGRRSVKEYSEDLFRQRVVEQFVSDARWEGVPPGTGKALRTWVLDEDLSDERQARNVLEDFAHEGYEFSDTWEWDFHDYDPAFLWCCHAIVAGIAQYDRAPKTPTRLRTAWESARQGRTSLRTRAAELESEVRRLNTLRGDAEQLIERERGYGEECVDIADLEAALMLSPQRQAEDPHDSPLHHDYALGHDRPGGAV
ncbi:hypothetical protein ACFY7C_37245 [Streptomyces sp. NPDC012769]|uniref:hypothetical protein n=1 Tax=Streptomyces sp. NPDC012769 TaxID=3364848 RepID=UPI003673C123